MTDTPSQKEATALSMFGFDEQYAYYGVTPVDNQFILEYLPNATGDAVRVYLYGLMQCYHPQQAMTIAQMARELSLTEEAILTAYRHWERKGLVRRIADNPPAFRYVSIRQLTMEGGAVPVDEEYEQFVAAVYGLFGNDRRLHGAELSRCYEWVEELGLPRDAVLALIRHMIACNGKNVAIKTIEKRAMQLAEEGVKSAEDAEAILNRDQQVFEGAKAVIRRMGKRRNPSEDELNLYRKWTIEWGFTGEDVLDACAETVKGDPNFSYLDGILNRLYQKKTATGRSQKVADTFAEEKDAAAPLKALLAVLGLPSSTINDGTLAVYQDMRALYPDAIILMAGHECSRHGVTTLDDVMNTLQNWKRNGLESAEDIRRYMKKINDQNDFLRVLYDVLGMEGVRPNAPDRRLMAKWLEDWGFDMTFVNLCAAWAAGKEKPMGYLDKMLEIYRDKGICTIDAAQKERESFHESFAAKAEPARSAAPARGPKTVEQQQYTQREYTHSDAAIDAMMQAWQEEKGNA